MLYGLLGVLATMGWQKAQRRPQLFWPILLAVLVGVVDELNQRSVQGRSPEVADWFADTAGILAGCLLVLRTSKEIRDAD